MTSVPSGTRPSRATRVCPSAGPRRPATGEAPAAFAGAPEATNAAARLCLPARSLRA
ncbi:DUF5949 family protein [Streptomyces dangxiongensis]|uniref:DUF5949 family protein n=1 Tax=Streptomyces dangxiongensis TaxID=1442032 RepID=UPI0013CE5FF0|nr:DUF5949 family protein [Streptomyces dangxiongensis]